MKDSYDYLDDYLPDYDEGDTMATQIATAVCKLTYKWYNDGLIYDNTHFSGECEELSSYANWLDKYIPETDGILDGIKKCYTGSDYESILEKLEEVCDDEELLKRYDKCPKLGSVYSCKGKFRCIEHYDDEYEMW